MTLSPATIAAILVWLAVVLMWAVRAGVNLERRRQRLHYPFTWHCPIVGCRYAVGDPDPGVVLTLTTDHERHHR